MASKASFSSAEWQLIKDAPNWVFAALAAADGNAAILSKAAESKAFKKATDDYSGRDRLVKDVLGETKTEKDVKGATLAEAEEALQDIGTYADAKLTDAEGDSFRDFLMAVANSVAEAASEGLFGAGKKISKKEEVALEKIAAALQARPEDKAARKAEAEKLKADQAAKAAAAKRRAQAAAAAAERRAKAEAAKAAAAKAAAEKARKDAEAKKKADEEAAKRQAAADKARAEAKARLDAKAAELEAARAKAEATLTEHTVVAGETLSHISLKYYSSAAKDKYMVIYEANKDVIGDNPNVIRPGQVLRIPKL